MRRGQDNLQSFCGMAFNLPLAWTDGQFPYLGYAALSFDYSGKTVAKDGVWKNFQQKGASLDFPFLFVGCDSCYLGLLCCDGHRRAAALSGKNVRAVGRNPCQ